MRKESSELPISLLERVMHFGVRTLEAALRETSRFTDSASLHHRLSFFVSR